MPANDNDAKIEAFYDGDCSLCSREVSWLRSRDRNGHIRFTNIAAPDFDADRDAGIPAGRLQKCIQARLATGEVVEGVEVFRHLYRIVGFQRLVQLTRLPGVSPFLDAVYRLFAKNRLLLAGRRVARTCAARRSDD